MRYKRVIEDQGIFQGIDAVNISTIDHIVRQNRLRMKQAYRVSFKRNSIIDKDYIDQCLEYVQAWFFIRYQVFEHSYVLQQYKPMAGRVFLP